MDLESMVCFIAAGKGALEAKVHSRKAGGFEDGVQEIPQRVYSASMSDCSDRQKDTVSNIVVEPMAGCVFQGAQDAAISTAMLRKLHIEVAVRTPRYLLIS